MVELSNPDQAHFAAFDEKMRAALLARSDALIEETEAALADFVATQLSGRIDAPSAGCLRAILLQHVFCRLCSADPTTLQDGDAAVAEPVLSNLHAIAHAWA